MTETLVRIGILGCAEIARKFSRAIQLAPNATLVAIGSRSLEKAQRFKAENSLPDSVRVHGSYEELLDDPSVEAVYMPLPTSLHVEWAVATAEKRKHLLLEKPVALCVGDFDRIVEACGRNGVQFMDGTMWMHHPRTGKMKELLSDTSRFGELKTIRCLNEVFNAIPIPWYSRIRERPMAKTLAQFGIASFAEIALKLSFAFYLASNATLLAISSHSIWKAQPFKAENRLPDHQCPFFHSFHVKWAVTAAKKKKHLPLERPVALCVGDFDTILEVCEDRVQFMDGAKLMYNLMMAKMKVHSTFSFAGDSDFLNNDIRVKPDLDSLGALGDAGWYCIRSILWAADYELPKTVVAHPKPVINDAGVILSCGSSLIWEDGRVATFHCSFVTHLTMELSVIGTRGTLHLSDFIVPFEENSASFSFGTDLRFTELVTSWESVPSKHVVNTDLPQEACMVAEFSRLVANIRDTAAMPNKIWPTISRKTQLVLDAVKASVETGFEPVHVVHK